MFRKHHVQFYAVGGWVRDKVLKKEAVDIDFVTDIPLDILKSIFGKEMLSCKILSVIRSLPLLS